MMSLKTLFTILQLYVNKLSNAYVLVEKTLQWRHIGHDGASNHQPHACLLNRLFRRRSKKTSNLRVNGLCAGNSPVTGGIRAQMVSNAANASVWWRRHDCPAFRRIIRTKFCSFCVVTILELELSHCEVVFSKRQTSETTWPKWHMYLTKMSVSKTHRFAWPHYSYISWASWCLKSQANRLFVKQLIQASNKTDIKVPRHWPFVRECNAGRWILTNAEIFPCGLHIRT